MIIIMLIFKINELILNLNRINISVVIILAISD